LHLNFKIMQKNVSLVLNIILAIAVCFLYYKQFSGNSQATESAKTVENEVVVDTKVDILPSDSLISDEPIVSLDGLPKNATVFVNVDTLFSKYEYYKVVKADLERKAKRLENEIEQRAKALEADLKRYQAKGETMTQEAYYAAQQDLMKKEQEIMQYREEQAGKLAEEEQRVMENLNVTILKFIKTNFKDKGYQYILGYSKGGGILFADDKLDITQTVIVGLNEEYKKKKK
jgi:outer membrane protein